MSDEPPESVIPDEPEVEVAGHMVRLGPSGPEVESEYQLTVMGPGYNFHLLLDAGGALAISVLFWEVIEAEGLGDV